MNRYAVGQPRKKTNTREWDTLKLFPGNKNENTLQVCHRNTRIREFKAGSKHSSEERNSFELIEQHENAVIAGRNSIARLVRTNEKKGKDAFRPDMKLRDGAA